MREGNLPVPLPLVTDLDGDGEMEVVVLADGGMTLRVLSVPVASGETLVSYGCYPLSSPAPGVEVYSSAVDR